MRAVIVSKAFVRGAYQRKLEEIARQPDVDLTLVTPPAWTDSGHQVRFEPRYQAGYRTVVLPIRFEGRFHVYHFAGLGGLLKQLRPDVVHADEEPYNLATCQTLAAARRVGARALFFTWQNINRRLPPPFRLLELYAYRQVGYAIAGNQDAAAVLRRKGYRGPLAVIPQFGVDPGLFHPGEGTRAAETAGASASGELEREPIGRAGLGSASAPEAGDGSADARPFTIGYLGRLIESKGLFDLLAAASGLSGEWRLDLVGDGPLRAPLQAHARELGIAERVEIRTEVPSTSVPGVLRRFDVLVLPSRTTPSWREQFGRTLVEAMACGVAVVGSSSGEIPHVIGEAGRVFPEGDVGQLRAALARLARDPAERRRLAELGRARVLARFTQASVAAATCRVYGELLQSDEPGRSSARRSG